MSVQLQCIIGSNIYREDDRPEYRRGDRVLIGIICLNISMYVFIKVCYTWGNKQKEQVWGTMTAVEKSHYLATSSDEGSKRLDFRFASWAQNPMFTLFAHLREELSRKFCRTPHTQQSTTYD